MVEQTEAELQGEKPIFNIVGEKVALGPMQKSMLPLFLRWANDFDVTIMSGDPIRPMRRELIEAEFEHDSKREESQDAVKFLIYEQASFRCIGTVSLRNINKTWRAAEYGILIGEKDCWGKGYGTETTLLMLDYAFTVLGLHTVLLRTYAYNERAVRAYTRAGFRVMGRWREAARLGDQVYDIIFMDCLATEFRSPLRRVIELP